MAFTYVLFPPTINDLNILCKVAVLDLQVVINMLPLYTTIEVTFIRVTLKD